MKGIISVGFFSGVLTALRMLSGFVIAKAVAVHGGPSGMAMLGQVQNLINSMSGIATASAGSGLVRYTAETYSSDYHACAPWWRATLRWTLCLTAITSLGAIIFARSISEYLFAEQNYYWVVVLAGIILPLSVLNTMIPSVLNGLQQYRTFISLGILSVIISTSIALALILQWGLLGALVSIAIFSAVSGVIMLSAAFTKPWFRWEFWVGMVDTRNLKLMGGYVAMAFTTAICAPASNIAVRYILIDNVGWVEAGYWQAVTKISEAYLGVITIALSVYFLPKLSRLSRIDDIKTEIRRTLYIVLPVALFLAACVYLARDVIIDTLLTSEFKSARNLFSIQLLGDVVKICAWLYAYPMLSRGATTWNILSEIAFASLFVFLTWLLISRFGTSAACISYSLSYCAYFLFTFKCINYYAR